MNSKFIISAIVLILLIGGGIFLWQQQGSDSEIKSTKWSQAGDYKITETPDGTVVENQKAGFSFRVPEGWEIKHEGDGVEYFLNLLSPDAKFDEDNFLLEGCFVNVETKFQRDDVVYLTTVIADLERNPGSRLDQKIILVGGSQALKTSIISSAVTDDPRVAKKINDTIQVEIPINATTVADFEIITKKNVEDKCIVSFEQFLSAISL